jgi:amino acid transporter
MGQARIYVVLGRERLLPPWLAAVHAARKTPVNATIVTAVSGGGRNLLPLPLPQTAQKSGISSMNVRFHP